MRYRLITGCFVLLVALTTLAGLFGRALAAQHLPPAPATLDYTSSPHPESDSKRVSLRNTANLSYTTYLPIIIVPFVERIVFAADGQIYSMGIFGDGVRALTTAGGGMPDWSPNRVSIVFDSIRDGNGEIYTMRANGTAQTNITNHPEQDGQPAWSADGSRIAFATKRDGNREIYTMQPDGSDLVRVTNNPADDAVPDWSPDGSKLVFASDRDGRDGIYVINSDGTGGIISLTDLSGWSPVWSPDGSQIAFESYEVGNGNIYMVNADGSGNLLMISDHPADDLEPDWSADGSQLVFSSNRNGDFNLYVVAADGSGEPRQLTSGFTDAHYPDWSWFPPATP
jgi:Tol biopolymer transport system component